MSRWSKLHDRSTAEPAGEPAGEHTPAVDVEIISGELSARVHLHEIDSPGGPLACWSYVSEGMAAHHQAEMVVTLRRDPGEASDEFPQEPLQLFATIYPLAAQGRRVAAGSFTELGAESFFGHHLLYVGAQPLPGVTLPSPCLAALLVTTDELRAVREFGSTRVLARMGQASSHYPFPPWCDRRRKGLSLARTFEHSVLSKIPRASDPQVRVSVTSNQVTVSALRSEQPSWRARLAQVPEHAPLALLTGLDPAADGCLVWVPGQKAPDAITPPGSDGSRVCACFIAFLGDQPDSGGNILEDGVAMELTREAWQVVRRALATGQELSIPAAGDRMPFALTWRDEEI